VLRLVLLTAMLCCATAAAQPLRRFAVIAGNDTGGADTRPLLYAREDARRIHGILTRLGGVQALDAQLLLNGTAGELLRALALIEQRAAEAEKRGEKTALIFYYSGHAKDGALRLGETRLPFDALRTQLSGSAADIRIGILDSCRSGLITRTKGARRAPQFEVQTDANRDARGLVMLTSSSADEDSQESDHIGGSYFSHHLASGLLGDADKSGDGRVSLSEAYAYAYERTLADTASSTAGAQHPTFSYDLAGNGDLVLTDVSRRSEGLVLPASAPAGTYYLVDARGWVAAEVVKVPDLERRIALAPGSYRVKRRMERHLRIGELEVSSNRLTVLDERNLKDAPFSDDPVKGGGRSPEGRWAVAMGGHYQTFFDADTRARLFPSLMLLGVEAQLTDFFRPDWVWSFDLAAGGRRSNLSLSTLSSGYRYSQLSLASSIWVKFPQGFVEPFVGARLAALTLTREFDDPSFPKQALLTFSPGIVFGARFRLTRSFALTPAGRLHYFLYNIDSNRSLTYGEVSVLMSYEFGGSP
jgi:hypothetical protein